MSAPTVGRSRVEGSQNVEVSKKLPSEKSPAQQLDIMEAYTRAHADAAGLGRERRELNCLQVLYPTLFRSLEADDLLAGRLDFLPIGFGAVTSVGGVGHYCVFDKLRAFGDGLTTAEDRARVDRLYEYWMSHDVKAIYAEQALDDAVVGRFIDGRYPMMATARLSGMMLDYALLCEVGLGGLRARIADGPRTPFTDAGGEAIDLLQSVIDHYVERLTDDLDHGPSDPRVRAWLRTDLIAIREQPPGTFHQALQLIWLYALIAGCINYGRLDDILGPYLVADLASGVLTEQRAFDIMTSWWTMIENRRTTVNGRIIVGGQGRRNPAAADEFARLALRTTRACRYVEPQFTLRFDTHTPQDIWDAALDSLGEGVTYPTLYNDDVNVPAVASAMRLDRETAEQYVPFGCGEFVIQGQSVGTPNVLLNLLKILQLTLNEGVDPMDGVHRGGPLQHPPLTEFDTFEALLAQYHRVLDWFMDRSVDAQLHSYRVMNEQVSFLFASLLTDDCIARGRALLDGGIRYLGGTLETYANINAADTLYAIKKLVYDEQRYSLAELNAAANSDFANNEVLRQVLVNLDKYGNDLDEVDALANDLYEYVARGVRDRGIDRGMQYFLIVISNNQTNTEWGLRTEASLDGRRRGQFLNPANNPQGGADRSGPTAMLNSLTRFDPALHGGSVQNIRFSPGMFNNHRGVVDSLMKTYFRRGGCHLMVTTVDRGVLEDAQRHPEKYPDLIVRVSGFSARFVDLDKAVQDELLSRHLYGE